MFKCIFISQAPKHTRLKRRVFFEKQRIRNSIPVSTQCQVTIGPPVKHHLMAFLWRANGGSPLDVKLDVQYFCSKV